MPSLRALSVTVPCLAVAACSAAPVVADFDAAEPAARIAAVQDAVRAEQNAPGSVSRATLRRLVEMLDASDAGVRAVAIAGLQRLTGETLGYASDDPPAARERAIERWLERTAGGGATDHG